MNPKQFLLIGGLVLLVLGLLGYATGGNDTVGPLGTTLWLTNGENVAHTVLGIVAILAAYLLGAAARKWLVIVVGLVALYYGVIGFTLGLTNPPSLNYQDVANLELLDNLIHLVVAGWAFWASMQEESLV